MAVKWVQDLYDRIRNFKTPEWMKILLGIAEDVLTQVFEIIKEEGKNFLKDEIYKQSKLDISGTEKLQNVANAFKKKYFEISIPRSWLNMAIDVLLTELKKSGAID